MIQQNCRGHAHVQAVDEAAHRDPHLLRAGAFESAVMPSRSLPRMSAKRGSAAEILREQVPIRVRADELAPFGAKPGDRL